MIIMNPDYKWENIMIAAFSNIFCPNLQMGEIYKITRPLGDPAV